MYEQVNGMPKLAAPLTNINIPKPIFGAAPDTRKDLGSGTVQVRLEAGEKRIVPLDSLSTSGLNDGGDITLQSTGAVTVQVTSGGRNHVQSEVEKLASPAAAISASLWEPVTVAVNKIEALPRNTSAVYLTAAAACVVVLRRT